MKKTYAILTDTNQWIGLLDIGPADDLAQEMAQCASDNDIDTHVRVFAYELAQRSPALDMLAHDLVSLMPD